MRSGRELPILLLGLAIGCGRSGLDVLGLALLPNGDADDGGGVAVLGASSGGVVSSGGTASSSSGVGSSAASGSSGGVVLTCADSATCVSGQVCCAAVNLSAGRPVTSACHASPCPSGQYQLCASGADCLGGATCMPNPLGTGPMICGGASSGGDPGTSGSSSGGDGGDGSAPPSCAPGGPGMTNCGPGGSGTESCCTSLEVSGGTYHRAYTNTGSGPTGETNPAKVSGFRLDKYLVTVGRFRQFVGAWNGGSGWLPPTGSGKHAYLNGGKGLNVAGGGYEPGWAALDNSQLVLTDARLACDGGFSTWTASAGSDENLPMNCVDWYEAYAFCIWDGGFLPSEAEFEYAAVGGSQERQYPWGSASLGTANQYAIYGCYYPNGSASCTSVANIAAVGTAAMGVGLWGQLDLAGGLWEWNLDLPGTNDVEVCTDCVNLTASLAASTLHVVQGGSYRETTSTLLSPSVFSESSAYPQNAVGLRCARAP